MSGLTAAEFHDAVDKAEILRARWNKRLVWRENRPPEHYITHSAQMDALARSCRDRLIMIECMSDRCASPRGERAASEAPDARVRTARGRAESPSPPWG